MVPKVVVEGVAWNLPVALEPLPDALDMACPAEGGPGTAVPELAGHGIVALEIVVHGFDCP